MGFILTVVLILAALYAVARIQAPLGTWTLAAGIALLFVTAVTKLLPGGLAFLLWVLFLFVMVPLNFPDLRKRFLSQPALQYLRRVLPPISATEREAIEAGTVWWEAELFRGNPDWDKLASIAPPKLTEAEQAFLDGPVEELCTKLDDWQITHELNDLPADIWEYLAEHGFYGLNIPKRYGGHEFSAVAQSEIVMKVASRSGTAGVTVMVPNSLGPAELLLHYGTDDQKNYYLPRLARGEEIPCFALTNPYAGSDAGAIPDYGIVCKGEYQGAEVIGLRVTWEKRYITLGPVATLLGLAFKAYDPDHLLGDQEELGITCALVPTDTPGVNIGTRHYPLNAAFQNGPNSGTDVFIPMEWVIGGEEWLGKGWRMLMESLAAGRGISLPASATAGAKVAARTSGAYARIREQFNVPIGKFEGIEEALARIGGITYLMDAARRLTTAGLAAGEKPAVISAIAKLHLTEGARQTINDAMDIHAGRGICMGPKNYLARGYQQIPIAITVEGANILTRSMIIFGQGAMRCHPYLLDEIAAAADTDEAGALDRFDKTLMAHLGYATVNKVRAFIYGLSNGWLAPAPEKGELKRYYRDLTRYSAAFAFLSDIALLMLGGALKRKEKLSGRFADALSHMFLCSAVLKHYEDTGRPAADLPLVHWACQYCLYNVQAALDGVLRNFPMGIMGGLLRIVIFPLGRRHRMPNDALGHEVASLLLSPSDTRDRLTQGIFITNDPDDVIGTLEDALHKVVAAEPVWRRVRDAGVKKSYLADFDAWLQGLVDSEVIEASDADLLREAHAATRNAIMVDDFAREATAAGTTHEAA